MAQPLCFIDSTYYDRQRFPEIAETFSAHPTICQVGDTYIQFKVVGILYAADCPIVVFPKNYGLTDDGNIVDAKTLARVLIRYKNEPQHDIEELPLLFGDANMSSGRISSAMMLLEDYCQNGFLRRELIVETTLQSGRIDWTATINKTIPVMSKKQLVYVNPIIRRRINDNNSLISKIHRAVITECFHEWGWFFGYDEFNEKEYSLPVSADEAIMLLRSELRNTFVERDINVIKLLIQFLTSKVGSEQDQKLDVLATPYFSFVWEAVCGFLLENQYARLRPLLPQPIWESTMVEGRISQRPDIFHVNDTNLYIFDAKYYDYNTNLPGWHDVVKQFFYRHTLVSILHSREFYRMLPETQEIYNAFLFPGSGSDFEYLGRVHVPRINDLGEIKAFSVNQHKALYAYAYRDDSTFRESIRHKVRIAFS